MEIVLLGGFLSLPNKLREKEIICRPLNGTGIHSLTALLLDEPDLCYLVLQAKPVRPWSDCHILAAAKLLQVKGRLILVGTGSTVTRFQGNPLVALAETEDAAFQIISKPKAAPPKKADTGGGQQLRRMRPLKISASRILLIDVVGSQPRIGCTTQAIALWHYFHALGADPAVVMAEPQIRQLTSTMQVQKKFEGGCVIDGITFVTDTQRSNDCYIRDLGCTQASHSDADAVVLVAGVKPWELGCTMQAIRTLHHRHKIAVLSFTDPAEVKKLQLLFTNGEIPAAAAEYIPNPWLITAEALLLFDKLLHPVLDQHLKEEMPCFGIEPQKTL